MDEVRKKNEGKKLYGENWEGKVKERWNWEKVTNAKKERSYLENWESVR